MKRATKKDLQKLNAAMVRFLESLIKDSDVLWNGRRNPAAEKNYQTAKKLVARATAVT